MKLAWFELNGFKRFAQHAKIHLDRKIIAIVGPNEAGKTSILHALLHFNHNRELSESGPSQEVSRDASIATSDVMIEATFRLDQEDRDSISQIPECAETRWFSITKRAGSKDLIPKLKPFPSRSRISRKAITSILQQHLTRFEEVLTQDNAKQPAFDSILATLQQDVDTLSADDMKAIHEFGQRLANASKKSAFETAEDQAVLATLGDAISSLASDESRMSPVEAASKILVERRPRFLLFSDGDRNLLSEYSLRQFFIPAPANAALPPIPKALANIADAASLSLEQLFRAAAQKDEGRIETLIEKANRRLDKIMHKKWSQADVSVRLRLTGEVLHIIVSSAGSQYVRISERSDGLRQFVALVMFMNRQSNVATRAILLIDEAEMHLHYDAQADLVQMLARQNLVSQVIYTTHSLGCLPEDLASVRLVEPAENHSRVVNWFWDSKRPGYSGLLFGIGARTLAFIPVRYALFTEGAADMLLLPALLREASRVDHLGFQIVPGLSSATEEQAAVIDRESPRTAYLVDSDQAGAGIRSKLIAAGIEASRILSLPDISGSSSSVVEDFIVLEKYVKAVNTELALSHGYTIQIKVDDLRGANRPKALEAWCVTREIKAPSKRAIAYRILDDDAEDGIADIHSSALLENLLIAIQSVLKIHDS